MYDYKIIHGDSTLIKSKADLIITDPPYDLKQKDLLKSINNIESNHLVLICTMKQLIDVVTLSDFKLSFDFVLDFRSPRKSLSYQQPHYTHGTGAYLIRNGDRSRFNRKKRTRSDAFKKGFWSTIIDSPRERANEHSMGKSIVGWTDLLGSFDIESVIDPFAGSGTTLHAALNLNIFNCTVIDIDKNNVDKIKKVFSFLNF